MALSAPSSQHRKGRSRQSKNYVKIRKGKGITDCFLLADHFQIRLKTVSVLVLRRDKIDRSHLGLCTLITCASHHALMSSIPLTNPYPIVPFAETYLERLTRSPIEYLYLWLPCPRTGHLWRPRQTNTHNHFRTASQPLPLHCRYAT